MNNRKTPRRQTGGVGHTGIHHYQVCTIPSVLWQKENPGDEQRSKKFEYEHVEQED